MRKNAFTLIELLVVISGISLLVAVLVPVLAMARQHGKTVLCLSNLRQFTIAADIYSNFDVLLKLQLDYLKIDGTLIEKMDTDVNSRIIVENIVNFSRKMGIKTIAEFVHSRKIYDIVKSLGIDYSQGFFLGEPQPAFLDAGKVSRFL
jgi:sensor c-di-GMP phosphodiesterase-like protein